MKQYFSTAIGPLALSAALLFSTTTGTQAQTAAGGKALIPPFIKVGSSYLVNAMAPEGVTSSSIIVKVIEISDTGWILVESKGKRSWLNVPRLISISEVSAAEATAMDLKKMATAILAEARILDGAVQQCALETKKAGKDTLTFEQIREFLPEKSFIFRSGGKDPLGNKYIIKTVNEGVRIAPETVKAFKGVLDDAYWGEFFPK